MNKLGFNMFAVKTDLAQEVQRMASKSRFVGVRFEPDQQRKLIVLSMVAGEPGNMSAALRYLVERAPMPALEGAGLSQHSGGEWQPERATVSA